MIKMLAIIGLLAFVILWVFCAIEWANAPEGDEEGNIINRKK